MDSGRSSTERRHLHDRGAWGQAAWEPPSAPPATHRVSTTLFMSPMGLSSE